MIFALIFRTVLTLHATGLPISAHFMHYTARCELIGIFQTLIKLLLQRCTMHTYIRKYIVS